MAQSVSSIIPVTFSYVVDQKRKTPKDYKNEIKAGSVFWMQAYYETQYLRVMEGHKNRDKKRTLIWVREERAHHDDSRAGCSNKVTLVSLVVSSSVTTMR